MRALLPEQARAQHGKSAPQARSRQWPRAPALVTLSQGSSGPIEMGPGRAPPKPRTGGAHAAGSANGILRSNSEILGSPGG